MKRYYLVEFGPVQKSVSASRKLADAFVASRVFADDLRKRVEELVSECGGEVLLPAHGNGNVYFIEIPSQTSQDTSAHLESGLRDIVQNVDQIRMRLRWVRLDKEEQEPDRAKVLKEAQGLLAGRSAIRDFEQLNDKAESASICTMCAEEPALPKEKSGAVQLKQGEHLCKFCEKRRYQAQKQGFPSMGEVASWSFKKAHPDKVKKLKEFMKPLLSSEHVGKIKKHIQNSEIRHIPAILTDSEVRELNGDFTFALSLSEVKEMLGEDGDNDTAEQLRDELNNIIAQALGETRPSPYVFVAHFDGDSMGKRFSKECSTWAQVQELSRNLGQYAQAIKDRIEDNFLAKVIYSAGDDLLIVGSPVDMMYVVDTIRELWKSQVGGGISGAVGLFHHKSSLRAMIEWVHAKTEEAKSREGEKKNTLCVGFSARAGQPERCFIENFSEGHELRLFRKALDFFKKEENSTSFIYDLLRYQSLVMPPELTPKKNEKNEDDDGARPTQGEDVENKEKYKDIIKALTRMMLKQKQMKPEKHNWSTDELVKITGDHPDWFKVMGGLIREV